MQILSTLHRYCNLLTVRKSAAGWVLTYRGNACGVDRIPAAQTDSAALSEFPEPQSGDTSLETRAEGGSGLQRHHWSIRPRQTTGALLHTRDLHPIAIEICAKKHD